MRVFTSFFLTTSALWTLSTGDVHAQDVICEPVKHCVKILETHDPDSFDYQVLREEFTRYGDPGKRALVKMAAGRDEVHARRALMILSDKYALTPDDLKALMPLWTKADPAFLTQIFKRYPTSGIRQIAIDTLGHSDPDIRTASRELIAASLQVLNPLQSTDFGKLAQAVVAQPTPELLIMLDGFDPAKTAPLLTRSLNHTNPDIVKTAYQSLYARDKEQALNVLVDTLMQLKNGEVDSALAISQLLTARHENRSEGFYLKFAKDISEDTEMSLSGRAAGFDALLRLQHLPDVPVIENTALQQNNLKYILDVTESVDLTYIKNLPKIAGDNPDPWLSIIWTTLKTHASPEKPAFIYQAGRYNTPVAREIVAEALTDQHDWRVISAAIQAAALQDNKGLVSDFYDTSRTHPISRVRAAADMAFTAINTGKPKPGPLSRPVNPLENRGFVEQANRGAEYCRADKTDLSKNARKLPYFDDVILGPNLETARYKLTSAEPNASGWFAGYDLGGSDGALIYFDNQSGRGDLILKVPVTAVLPIQRPLLGQTASRFWVITKRSETMPDGGTIYRVTRSDNRSIVKLHASLPDIPDYVSEAANGDVFIAFKNPDSSNTLHVNPPLLLSSNGTIIRACDRAALKASYQN